MINDQFQRQVLKVSEPDSTRQGQSRVRKFVSECTCSPETKQAKEAYDALAANLELMQRDYKSLTNNGSSSTQELASLRTRISKLVGEKDDMKQIISKSKCHCWAETAYEIWDEPETMYRDDEDLLGLLYREHRGTKFYLDDKGYFFFNPELEDRRDYLPLGYGVFYRSPYYKPLHLCQWHGTLTQNQKNEIAKRIPKEGESVIMDYANPVQYLDITTGRGYISPYFEHSHLPSGKHESKELVTEKAREFLIVNSEGPSSTYGVYVYIKYGNEFDIACYDTCYEQSVDARMSELSFNDDKVKRLRNFIKNVISIQENVVQGYNNFDKFIAKLKNDMNNLRKINLELANLDAQNQKREVDTAKEAVDRAEKNLAATRLEAESNWAKKILKARNTKTMLEETKVALKGVNLKSFEELLKMEQPAEDAPELTIRLYNAIILYDNYDIEVEDGDIPENISKRQLLKSDVMDLQIQNALKQKAISSYDFNKILATEFVPESSPLEDQLIELIGLYTAQVQAKADTTVITALKDQILTVYANIQQEKENEHIMAEILEIKFSPEEDSADRRTLAGLVQTYTQQTEEKQAKAAVTRKQILSLYAEIQEEEEEDREFVESLSKSLVNTAEMDMSKLAQDNYIEIFCSNAKTIYTNALSTFNIKSNILRNQEAKRPTLERDQINLTADIAKNNNGLYTVVTRAHFYGKWFLEQSEEFLNLGPGERFSIEEEEETETVLSPQKLKAKQIYQSNQFTSIQANIIQRCNNVNNLLKTTQVYLTRYKELWPEKKILDDYNAYVRLQKEGNMSHSERDRIKEAAARAAEAKGIITLNVSEMTQQAEDDFVDKPEISAIVIKPTFSSTNTFKANPKPVRLTFEQRYEQQQRLKTLSKIKGPMSGPMIKTTTVDTTSITIGASISIEGYTVGSLPPFIKPSTPVKQESSSVKTTPVKPAIPSAKGTFTPTKVLPPTSTFVETFETPFEGTENKGRVVTPNKVLPRPGIVMPTQHAPLPPPSSLSSPRAKSPVAVNKVPLKASSPIKGMKVNLSDFPALPVVTRLPKAPVRAIQASPKPVSPKLETVLEEPKPVIESKEITTIKPTIQESKKNQPKLALKKVAPLSKQVMEPKQTPVAPQVTPPPQVAKTEVEPPKPKPKPIVTKPKSIKPQPVNPFKTLANEEN